MQQRTVKCRNVNNDLQKIALCIGLGKTPQVCVMFFPNRQGNLFYNILMTQYAQVGLGKKKKYIYILSVSLKILCH